MNLGKYQLVISVSVILASAIVALLFDYLKRNNERLREANTELKARRAKELKRLQRVAAAKSPSSVPEAAAPMPMAQSIVEPVQLLTTATVNEIAPTVETASETVAIVEPMAIAPVPEVVALAESNIETMPELIATEPIVAINLTTMKLNEEPSIATEEAPAQAGSRRNWAALLTSARPAANQPTLASVVKTTVKLELPFLPAGFHSEVVLRESLGQNRRVTGLAVSIGANVTEGPALEEVDQLVKSLLQSQDFAAPSSAGEYALMMPNEIGASAQRRLNLIAQQLWDFQITWLREHPVVLSWGGLEVRDQLLDEALASAEERMLETKRNRKVLPMELRESRPELRRRAV